MRKNLASFLQEAARLLEEIYPEKPQAALEARYLLSAALDIASAKMLAEQKTLYLSEAQEKRARKFLTARLTGMPLAYLTGKKEFWGREFLLDHNALIPRPESEDIIALGLAEFDAQKAPSAILDLGCGSGALLASLMCEFKNTPRGVGIDISHAALKIAQKNINQLEVSSRCWLINSSWNESLASNSKFELIVANPPYVESSKINAQELKHEPALALDGGRNGLAAYPKVALAIAQHLNQKRGRAIVEFGQGRKQEVEQIFCRAGLVEITPKISLLSDQVAVFAKSPTD